MKFFYLILIFTFLSAVAIAQTPHYKINEKTVVRDNDGGIYPYIIWSVLVKKTEYELQPLNKENEKTEFILVRLNEAEKNKRLEKMSKPRESDYFKTGKEFKFFKTTDIDNRKIDLRQDKGKIIVINFWFIDCPPCRMEIPDLNELVETYKGNDSIRFIGVALDARADLREFFQREPFNYQIVDSGRDIANRYGIRGYPTHVVIDQQGKVYFHTTGLGKNTAYWIKKSIDELVNQSGIAKQ